MHISQIITWNLAKPQPWRNGGGVTREYLTWPDTQGPWALRLSVADIQDDGPFSAFPDVQRWLAVLEGGGVDLNFGDLGIGAMQGSHLLRVGDKPLSFDGQHAPHCRLLSGPTRDLNLMVTLGMIGGMRSILPTDLWLWPIPPMGRGLWGLFHADMTLHWTEDARTAARWGVPAQAAWAVWALAVA